MDDPLRKVAQGLKERPVSDYIQIYIQRKMPNGRYERIKFFEGRLQGAGTMGELLFDKMFFERGEYEIVVIGNPAEMVQRDRYGKISYDRATNTAFSILMKPPNTDAKP